MPVFDETLTLDEAVGLVRAAPPGETVAVALGLLERLDPAAEAVLAAPARFCRGRRCGLTPRYRVEGCRCARTAVALRLVDLAREATEEREPLRVILRHAAACAACGRGFESREPGRRYCPTCDGSIADERAAKRRRQVQQGALFG